MSSGCFNSSTNTTPEADNTPVSRELVPTPRNFIMLLGAPGVYNSSDTAHDQFWGNYFVAAQHIFGGNGFDADTSLLQNECVHWLVYGSAYEARWRADRGASQRFLNEAAAQYSSGGYLGRIQAYIRELGRSHRFILIDTFQDLWETLHTLPNGSLTRLMFFGHGEPDTLFLRWSSNNGPTDAERVSRSHVSTYESWLSVKAKPDDNQISKFYSCRSSDWAETWHTSVRLKAEGAADRISFRRIRERGGLRELERSGNPWQTFY